MRKPTSEEIKSLLSRVTFTKASAFALFTYCFVCASVGYASFVLLAEDRFTDAVDETRNKVNNALVDARRLYEKTEDSLKLELERGYFNLPQPENFVGPLDLALSEKAPVQRVKGQKRLCGKNYYEVRFVPRKNQ